MRSIDQLIGHTVPSFGEIRSSAGCNWKRAAGWLINVGRYGYARRPRLLAETVFVALVTLSGCDVTGPGEIKDLPRELTVGEHSVVRAGNAFAFDLLRTVAAREGSKNIFLSPLSASYALAMTLNGAEGETYRAIVETLQLQGMDLNQINASYSSLTDLLVGLDESVELGIANALWWNNEFSINQTFTTRVQGAFDAEIRPLDFGDPASVDIINDWVSEATQGKIPTMTNQINPNDVLYLMNAVYFNAPWVYPFKPAATRDAPFRLTDDSSTTVEMMSRYGSVRMFRTNAFVAADLLYGRGAYSMTIVVPSGDATVAALIGSLDTTRWAAWMDEFRRTDNVSVRIPRFQLQYNIKLSDALKSLGMDNAFDCGRADFSGISAAKTCIDRIKQKTYLKVNEEGTEAAAATSSVVIDISRGPTFVADRPFLLVIRERFSGTILFIGQIIDPAASAS